VLCGGKSVSNVSPVSLHAACSAMLKPLWIRTIATDPSTRFMPILETHSGAAGTERRLEGPGADENEPTMCWKDKELQR